jgi:hypothetical protein
VAKPTSKTPIKLLKFEIKLKIKNKVNNKIQMSIK